MKEKIKISDTAYWEILDTVVPELWNKDYFSGVIKMDFGDYYYVLECSVALRYDICRDEEFYGATRMCSVTPIWWNFWAEDISGEKYETDFSFDELLRYFNFNL